MICGVDEAGRGPVMGPMVVAGLLIDSEAQLEGLDVKDSKKLSAKKRTELAIELNKRTITEVIIVPAADIDTMRNHMTMNQIETKIFAGILEKLKPDVAYVDSADVDEKRFGRDIQTELGYEMKIVSKHGADDLYRVVSAASIIAKTTRDSEIEKIKSKLGDNMGSGYPSDAKTITFLENWIKEHGSPPPHTRHSWKTTQRILDQVKSRKIDDY